MRVEDEYPDLLQNIEWALVNEFRNDASLLDLDVRDAVGSLVRHYEAVLSSSSSAARRLSAPAERVFEAVRAVCEWRLGHAAESPQFAPANPEARSPAITPATLVLCLKRIRKSIDLWTKQGGRQGYLRFVANFIN